MLRVVLAIHDLHEAIGAVGNADHIPPPPVGALDHGSNDSIEAGAVAAAGENANTLKSSHRTLS